MHPHVAHHQPSDDHLATYWSTAVAIDKDRNSQHAVRWAVDHLLINSPNVVLIHVQHKIIHHNFSMTDSSPDAVREQAEAETQQLFLPYRGFCARKGVHVQEVVLEDLDVSKALIEYINSNSINNLVVGASNRNMITRKFRNPDVPSSVMKSAPDFCAVYVITKGRVASVRSANRPAPNSGAPPRQSHAPAFPPHLPIDHLDHDDAVK